MTEIMMKDMLRHSKIISTCRLFAIGFGVVCLIASGTQPVCAQDEAAVKGDYDAITRTVQHYVDGAKSGSGDEMKPAFHEDATIFGYVGTNLSAGPIQDLFDRVDAGSPAPEIQARITSIDVEHTVATVRLESENWNGRRFTDLFTLLKVDGEWKIMNKVFYLHP